MSGQDALLATKLHVPRPQPGFAPRPRLAQALSQGLSAGKSADLRSGWIRQNVAAGRLGPAAAGGR